MHDMLLYLFGAATLTLSAVLFVISSQEPDEADVLVFDQPVASSLDAREDRRAA